MAERCSRRGSGSTRSGSCGSPRAGTGSATAAPPSSRSIRSRSEGSRSCSADTPLAAATLVSNAAFSGRARRHLPAHDVRALRTHRADHGAPDVPLPDARSSSSCRTANRCSSCSSVTAFWAARRGRWVVAGARARSPRSRAASASCSPRRCSIEALHQRAERRGPGWPGLLAAAATGGGSARVPRVLVGSGRASGSRRSPARRTGSARFVVAPVDALERDGGGLPVPGGRRTAATGCSTG